jgi:hypothetical protein
MLPVHIYAVLLASELHNLDNNVSSRYHKTRANREEQGMILRHASHTCMLIDIIHFPHRSCMTNLQMLRASTVLKFYSQKCILGVPWVGAGLRKATAEVADNILPLIQRS